MDFSLLSFLNRNAHLELSFSRSAGGLAALTIISGVKNLLSTLFGDSVTVICNGGT